MHPYLPWLFELIGVVGVRVLGITAMLLSLSTPGNYERTRKKYWIWVGIFEMVFGLFLLLIR